MMLRGHGRLASRVQQGCWPFDQWRYQAHEEPLATYTWCAGDMIHVSRIPAEEGCDDRQLETSHKPCSAVRENVRRKDERCDNELYKSRALDDGSFHLLVGNSKGLHSCTESLEICRQESGLILIWWATCCSEWGVCKDCLKQRLGHIKCRDSLSFSKRLVLARPEIYVQNPGMNEVQGVRFHLCLTLTMHIIKFRSNLLKMQQDVRLESALIISTVRELSWTVPYRGGRDVTNCRPWNGSVTIEKFLIQHPHGGKRVLAAKIIEQWIYVGFYHRCFVFAFPSQRLRRTKNISRHNNNLVTSIPHNWSDEETFWKSANQLHMKVVSKDSIVHDAWTASTPFWIMWYINNGRYFHCNKSLEVEHVQCVGNNNFDFFLIWWSDGAFDFQSPRTLGT